MTRFSQYILTCLFAASVVLTAGAAKLPSVEILLSTNRVIVAEQVDATVKLYLPTYKGAHANELPFSRRYPPSFAANFLVGTRPELKPTQEEKDGVKVWCLSFTVPVKTAKAGTVTLGPLEVEIPDPRSAGGFFSFFGEPTRSYRAGCDAVELVVENPPSQGRDKTCCGAIAEDETFQVISSLDARVCMAGDPLLLTLEIKGAKNPQDVFPPKFAELNGEGDTFKLDTASLRTATDAEGNRKFTWRVRAKKVGTGEFPALKLSFFDLTSRKYKERITSPIPVQVKAGAQAVIASVEQEVEDVFPMPDGLEMLPDVDAKDFSLQRAWSVATKARDEASFKEAVKIYNEALQKRYVEDGTKEWKVMLFGSDEERSRLAIHLCNIAALEFFANNSREAQEKFARAEWFIGSTELTRRGQIAAMAKLRNDARAELDLLRMFVPWFFEFDMRGRVGLVVGLLLVGMIFRMIFSKLLTRLAVIAFIMILAGNDLRAQGMFNFHSSFSSGFGGGNVSPIAIETKLTPEQVVIGEPCKLEIKFDYPNTLKLSGIKIDLGLDENIEQSELMETTNCTWVTEIKFHEVADLEFVANVRGVYSGRYSIKRGNSSFSGMTTGSSFVLASDPLHIKVIAPPLENMPDDFNGAVGSDFEFIQKFEPAAVRPGDLVTAIYTLKYEGYYPTNVIPRIDFKDGLNNFKIYKLEESNRKHGLVEWRQSIVPLNTNAVLGAEATIAYYNPSIRKYVKVEANRPQLKFLGAEASTKENTVVTVAGTNNSVASGPIIEQKILNLHFAPSENSPVVCTVNAQDEQIETARKSGWIRIKTKLGAGWIRVNLKP